MHKKRGRSTALILSLVILAVAGCADATSGNQTEASRIAPDFTLQSPTGEDVTLSQFQGKKNVLLVFGATWCPHCVDEIPELKEIYGKYKDEGLKLLSIAVRESAKKLQGFAQKHLLQKAKLQKQETTSSLQNLLFVNNFEHPNLFYPRI